MKPTESKTGHLYSPRLFYFFALLAFGMMLLQRSLNAGLTTAAAPANIVSYELARTPDRTVAILKSWQARPEGLVRAARSLWWDFLFLFAYGGFFALACRRIGNGLGGFHPAWWTWGRRLAVAALAAAVFDLVENTALLLNLDYFREDGVVSPPLAALAFWAALLKFLLLLPVIAYCLTGGVIWWRRERPGS